MVRKKNVKTATTKLKDLELGTKFKLACSDTTGILIEKSIGAATVDESILTGEGWGRAEWGEFAWGVNYSVAVTGQSLSSSIGEETAFTDCTVQVSGQSLTSTLGSF